MGRLVARGAFVHLRLLAVAVFALCSFLLVYIGTKQQSSKVSQNSIVEWKGFEGGKFLSFTIPPRHRSDLPPPRPPPQAPPVFDSRLALTSRFPGCSHREILCNETYEEHPESDNFDLTIVIAGRNDDYGGVNGTGGSLERFQRSLKWMDFHLRRLHLNVSVEMIIVDWNPPADRPPLSEVVFKPPSLASMRFITVPPHVHRSLSHIYGPMSSYADVLEFYAKNIAIRRSRSKWILPLALDTVLTGEWWEFLALRNFESPSEPVLYRMFRVDLKVPMPEPEKDWKSIQEHLLHKHVKVVWGVADSDFGGGGMSTVSDVGKAGAILDSARSLSNTSQFLKRTTQACGDFQMMSRQNWFAFKGYWECPSYGHFDSVIMAMAFNRGMRGLHLMDPMFVMHPFHASGGFFKRKSQLGVPETDFGTFLRDKLQHNSNSCNWGYANMQFSEMEWSFGQFLRVSHANQTEINAETTA